VRLFSSVDRQITLSFVLDYPRPRSRAGSRPPGRPVSCPVTTTPAVSRRRSWPNECAPTCSPLPPGTVAGKSFSAQSFTRLLQLLNSQLAEFDDAVAPAVAEHPDGPHLRQFPRRRPDHHRGATRRDRRRPVALPRPEVLLAEAGLAPVTRSSGRSRVGHIAHSRPFGKATAAAQRPHGTSIQRVVTEFDVPPISASRCMQTLGAKGYAVADDGHRALRTWPSRTGFISVLHLRPAAT
jgi:hypothetical protein